jgi:hypothetical protein
VEGASLPTTSITTIDLLSSAENSQELNLQTTTTTSTTVVSKIDATNAAVDQPIHNKHRLESSTLMPKLEPTYDDDDTLVMRDEEESNDNFPAALTTISTLLTTRQDAASDDEKHISQRQETFTNEDGGDKSRSRKRTREDSSI